MVVLGYGRFLLNEVQRERESSFIDNLLVRIHLIIVMISVDRPCAMVHLEPTNPARFNSDCRSFWTCSQV